MTPPVNEVRPHRPDAAGWRNDIQVYAIGMAILACCVPSHMTVAELERAVNNEHQRWYDSPWRLAPDAMVADGLPQPGPCEEDATRTHYLFQC